MPLRPSLLPCILSCLIATSILSSCSHSGGSDGGNPVNNSYLASARIITSNSLRIDSFSYDDQKRVARFAQYATEGSNSADVVMDFSFSGSNPLPTSYTATYDGGTPAPHQLTFDGQGRILKDTSTDGSHFVTYYTYAGNYAICKILFDGTITDAQIDTLIVTDGDFTGLKVWGEDGGSWEQQGNITYGHAKAANPGYKAEIANAVGPLLYVLSIYNYGGYGDYISKTIMNKVNGQADGLPPAGISYTVSTDSKGRVSAITPTGAGVPAGVKTAFTYY